MNDEEKKMILETAALEAEATLKASKEHDALVATALKDGLRKALASTFPPVTDPKVFDELLPYVSVYFRGEPQYSK